MRRLAAAAALSVLIMADCRLAGAPASAGHAVARVAGAPAAVDSEPLPPWDVPAMVGELARAADVVPDRLAAFEVLAWRIEEDERPLRVEQVFLWLQVAPRWPRRSPTCILLDGFRHPGRDNRWHLSFAGHADWPPPIRRYARRRPTRADARTVGLSQWCWAEHLRAPDFRFRFLAGELREQAWHRAFGPAPAPSTRSADP